MVFNPAHMQVNLDEFELVPEAKKATSYPAVNVSQRGIVRLNERLKAEIKKHTDSFQLGFSRHKDKHSIFLFVTDEPNYTFPASGARKDPAFTRSLAELGVELPTQYIVAWNEQFSGWVGVLKEGMTATTPSHVGKKTRGRKKVQQ